jgi:cobalt-zinc-cadmium efflux system protein
MAQQHPHDGTAHGGHHSHDQHDHDHGHSTGHHGHHHAPASFGTAFAVGAVLNIGFVCAEIVYGLAANSVALLADAAHNLGDVLALLLSWGAAVMARRLPSQRRTYGWGRSTILAALINASVLLIGVGAIAVEAIRRFADPQPVAGGTVMWVAGIGIAVNLGTALLFTRGHADLNIRAAFLHMMADAAVSAGVVAAALLIGWTGFEWIDPLASLAIGAVIAWGTWGVLRDAVNLSVDGMPSGIAHGEVKECLQALPGVTEVHDLHVWGLSTTETALTAHLVRDEGDDTALIRNACDTMRQRFGIGHVTLQLETAELAECCQLRPDHVV